MLYSLNSKVYFENNNRLDIIKRGAVIMIVPLVYRKEFILFMCRQNSEKEAKKCNVDMIDLYSTKKLLKFAN